MDWAQTTARRHEKHFSLGIGRVLYKSFYGILHLQMQILQNLLVLDPCLMKTLEDQWKIWEEQ